MEIFIKTAKITHNLTEFYYFAYIYSMLRTILKPDTQKISLSIPAEYVGEEVEILVFPVSDSANIQEYGENTEKNRNRRQEAFQNFMRYKGSLPEDFDYKKELAEYRNEPAFNFK